MKVHHKYFIAAILIIVGFLIVKNWKSIENLSNCQSCTNHITGKKVQCVNNKGYNDCLRKLKKNGGPYEWVSPGINYDEALKADNSQVGVNQCLTDYDESPNGWGCGD